MRRWQVRLGWVFPILGCRVAKPINHHSSQTQLPLSIQGPQPTAPVKNSYRFQFTTLINSEGTAHHLTRLHHKSLSPRSKLGAQTSMGKGPAALFRSMEKVVNPIPKCLGMAHQPKSSAQVAPSPISALLRLPRKYPGLVFPCPSRGDLCYGTICKIHRGNAQAPSGLQDKDSALAGTDQTMSAQSLKLANTRFQALTFRGSPRQAYQSSCRTVRGSCPGLGAQYWYAGSGVDPTGLLGLPFLSPAA